MSARTTIVDYLDPIKHLGVTKYSVLFAFLATGLLSIFSEIYALWIIKDPSAVGVYIIFLNIVFIIYFAFRDGIRGGFVSAGIAITYYFYIVVNRHYAGSQFSSGIVTIIGLAFVYIFLAWIIGWLKQKIDGLIERESNEKRRLNAIIQQLPVGVIITDAKGRIIQTNRQVDSILGSAIPTSTKSSAALLLQKLEKGDSSPQAVLLKTLATSKQVTDQELLIKKPNGKHVHISVSAAPVHSKAGKLIAVASIIKDITGLKEMDERKDDFVNMASHELKTPITSMKLYLDSLLIRVAKYDDPGVTKMLTSIKYQTERLQALVNDLLDVSRLQTGKLSLNKENFRIDELIEDTIEALQGTTKKQTIRFTKKTSLTVHADRFRIYQVFTNLITNAVKYSPPQTDIIVSIKKDGDKALISVEDFGLGIEKTEYKRIFDRLYQVVGSKEKTFPGLGMGLYISKEIIERHKGKIWVESQRGKGSTFFFSLPLLTKTIERKSL